MNDFMKILDFRHACKVFDSNKVVSDSDMRYILESGIKSPSSFGQEPWKFLVISDNDLKKRIFSIACQQEQIISSSHLVVILVDTENIKPESGMPKKMFSRFSYKKEEVESYVNFYTSHLKKTFETKNGRYEWSSRQAYIASSNMMMAGAYLGIDSCPMEGFDKEKLENILNLKDSNYQVSMLLPFGYRLNEQPKKVRQKFDSIVEFIK